MIRARCASVTAKFTLCPDHAAWTQPASGRPPRIRAGCHAGWVLFAEGCRPALLKIDVEGSEVAVLRGAPRLLSRRESPAILLEYNRVTLSECGANGRSLGELLSGYALHYVDDLEGQIISFGSPVSRIDEITWICNLFAVPPAEDSSARWASALKHAVHRLEGRNGSKHLKQSVHNFRIGWAFITR